jgi:hypothetical protein
MSNDKKTIENIVDWAKNQLSTEDQYRVNLQILAGVPLKPARKKVLAAMLLPGGTVMTKERIAEFTGVSVRTVYNAINDPEFKRAMEEGANKYLSQYLPALWANLVEKGMSGHFPAMVKLLEAGGLLKRDQVSQTVNLIEGISEADRYAKLVEGEKKFAGQANIFKDRMGP